jgi:hypothetical protein
MVIEVIGGIHAAQHRLEVMQPARHLAIVRLFLLYDIGHMLRVEGFSDGKGATRTMAQTAQHLSQAMGDDVLPYSFMVKAVLCQVILVKGKQRCQESFLKVRDPGGGRTTHWSRRPTAFARASLRLLGTAHRGR